MEEDHINFIVDQIILLSIYYDKEVIIRSDVVAEMKKINSSILDMLQSEDNFMIYNALREIRELVAKKELDMDDALEEAKISLLLRDEKYTRRDKKYLDRLRKEIKDAVLELQKGIPVEIPVKLYQDLGIDVFSYTVQNKWRVVEIKDTKKDKRINAILNRYPPAIDVKVREHIKKELEGSPDNFIKELFYLDNKALEERIDAWSDYDNELVDLFDKVAQGDIAIDEKDFKRYRSEYRDKEVKDPKFTKIRDRYTNAIYNIFIKYGNPSNYRGKERVISKEYIRKTLLPFILFFYNRVDKNPSETYAYGGYIVAHMKSKHRNIEVLDQPTRKLVERYLDVSKNRETVEKKVKVGKVETGKVVEKKVETGKVVEKKVEEQIVTYKLAKPSVGQKVIVEINEKKKNTEVKEIIERTESPLEAIDLIALKDGNIAAIVAGRWELLYVQEDNSVIFT